VFGTLVVRTLENKYREEWGMVKISLKKVLSKYTITRIQLISAILLCALFSVAACYISKIDCSVMKSALSKVPVTG
jgi:hypothetical protein